MSRLILFLVAVIAVAGGLSWLADRPGQVLITWEGYEFAPTVFQTVVILGLLVTGSVFVWSLLRQLWQSPATVGRFFTRRRQKRGLDALSGGIIAIGSGDRAGAARYAVQARKALPNEPLTHLLRAQAAQLSGDKQTSRRIFEAMLGAPDTELLGLRGLYLEAQREGEKEAARNFAERALAKNPRLGWPSDALFEIQCKEQNWQGALETLAIAKKHGLVDKTTADRRRAVLLAGQAQDAEDLTPDKALTLALEAHALAPDLVPAAAVAGRLLAAKGNTSRAAKVIQKTWSKAPHPDLAAAYAYARIGDSTLDRLERVRKLALNNPTSPESSIAIANAAIDARQFDEARRALEPLVDNRLTQRVATLMARIEAMEQGNSGRVREWLARAVNAERDPAWTADGVVSERWAPVSPVTGALDAFQWRVPVETMATTGHDVISQRLEELVSFAEPEERDIKDVTVEAQATEVAAPVAPQASQPAVKVKPRRPARIEQSAPAVQSKPQPGTAITRKGPAQEANVDITSLRERATTLSVRPSVSETAAVAIAAAARTPQSSHGEVKNGNGRPNGEPEDASKSLPKVSFKTVRRRDEKVRAAFTPVMPDDPGLQGDDMADEEQDDPKSTRTARAAS